MYRVLGIRHPAAAVALTLCCILGAGAPAAAQPVTYLWGIVRNGCRMDESVARAVEARLQQMGESVRRLQLNPMTEISSCTDKECATRLLQVCPGTAGTLIGGYLEEKRIQREGAGTADSSVEDLWLRLRLWKVDLATQKTTLRTHVCRGCSATDFVSRHAADLSEPAAQDTQELSCPRASIDYLTEKELSAEPERLVLMVSGLAKEGRKVRRPLVEALRRHLRLTHREVALEENKHAQPLVQLRRSRGGEQLLEISLLPSGQARLQYLAQSATEPATEQVECFGCSEEDLVHRVMLGVSSLLDRCYGDGCRRAEQSVALHRSRLLCAPIIPPAECGSSGPSTAASRDPSAPPEPPQPDFLVPPCARAGAPAGAENPPLLLRADAEPADRVQEARRSRLQTAGISLLSVGAAGLVSMAVVLASNGQGGIGMCSDPLGQYPDAPCRIVIPHAAAIAATLGTVGGGLVIGGGILQYQARRRAQPSAR